MRGLKKISVRLSDSENPESDLIVLYQGVDSSGQQFFTEVGEMVFDRLAADLETYLALNAEAYNIFDDVS